MAESQLNVIDATTTRIADIVSALMHISRDSSDEKFSICTFNEVLNDVQSLCRTKFKMKGIKLEILPNEVNLLDRCYCLRIQLSQVLLNVLVNASDAVDGLQDAWVKVKLQEDKDFFYFKITDSGAGVPEEVRPKLFEPFFTTKELGSGTGLGLSISKDIMLRHSGDIYFDYTDGTSCFTIKLPKVGHL